MVVGVISAQAAVISEVLAVLAVAPLAVAVLAVAGSYEKRLYRKIQ
jgi:hypothetical protein